MNDFNDPITIHVTHSVKSECKDEFVEWTRKIAESARQFAGFEGSMVFPPSEGESHLWHIVFRFTSMDLLNAFWESQEFTDGKEALSDLVSDHSSYRYQNGIEFWFDRDDSPGHPHPPTYKMAVVVLLAILPLSWLVPPVMQMMLSSLPVLIQSTLTTVIIVGIMCYGAMPILTRILSSWLYSNE